MKIIYLALIEPEIPSGPTIHTFNVMKGFKAIDAKVRLLCPKPSISVSEMDSFDCQFIPFFGYGIFRLLIFNICSMIQLMFNIIQYKPDVVYLRDRPGTIYASLISRLFKISTVLELNGVIYSDFATIAPGSKQKRISSFNKLYLFLRRSQLRRMDGIIFCGVGLQEKYCKAFNLSKEKTICITPHLDCELFKPLKKEDCRDKLHIASDAMVIGYVGNICERYDVDILKDLLVKLSKRGMKTRLLIVGRIDNEFKAQMLAGINDEKLILFAGQIDHSEIPCYINAMDIGTAFVKHSFVNDAASFTKVKEYLASGIPVALNSSDLSMCSHYPKNSIIGFEEASSENLSIDNVAAVFAEKHNLNSKSTSKVFSEFIVKNYNLTVLAKKTLDFFREIIANK